MRAAVVWLINLAFVSFFSFGFLTYHEYIQTTAYGPKATPGKTRLYRARLSVITIGLGCLLALGPYFARIPLPGQYFNAGIFVLVVGMMDTQLSRLEYALRCLAVVLIWLKGQTFPLALPHIIALVAILAVFEANWLIRNKRPYRWQLFVTNVLVSALFWVSLSPAAYAQTGGHVDPVRGIWNFAVLALVANLFWIRTQRSNALSRTLARQATYDTLTQMKNFTVYQHEVTDMFSNAMAKNEPLTLVAMDIDHFKAVNDTYGHLAGNDILVDVTAIMDEVLQRHGMGDNVYRTGGEEFTMAFAGKTPEEILPVVSDIWLSVRNKMFHFGEHDIAVTLSVGLTGLRVTDTSIDDAFKRADDSLYASKKRGRDAITLDGEPIMADQEGVHESQYAYFAQPIVDSLQPGTPQVACELLLRRYEPDRARWALPDNFNIPVQKQLQLLQQALQATGMQTLTMNLTIEQFSDIEVAKAIAKYKRNTPALRELIVEITEVPGIVTVRHVTGVYRMAGIKIFIDDVGSDNSYEVVPKLLPFVDGVKFAMQNLRESGKDDDNLMKERVRFWTQIAEDNDLEFILEGVEDADEMEYAREEYQVQRMQGYYFGKPAMPAGEPA